MGNAMRLAAGLVLAALALTGCDRGGGSAPAGPPVDRSSQVALDAAVSEALLADPSAHDWAAEPLGDRGVNVVGHRLLQACGAKLASDERIVAEQTAGWQGPGGLPALDQVVLAYDRPIAADAIRQARAALTCHTYDSPFGAGSVAVGALLDLGPAAGGGENFGFCEAPANGPGNARCVTILGAGQIACAVRVLATDQATAADRLRALMPALLSACHGGA
ncbi:hypothetical protein [Dactylosporangium sp. NPDC051484]|uniref:hypothetical protein n=1 Tax=Dactylosporangium sp. NPDC051484 TaxID=3154942 RepID=UPI003450E208